jgi:hypothetical protein
MGSIELVVSGAQDRMNLKKIQQAVSRGKKPDFFLGTQNFVS